MAWRISPDTFDVIVIGSGLPECLVAASLVKAGKSVLIIDAVDTYGTDFASFTPAALRDAILQQKHQSGAASRTKPTINTAVDAIEDADNDNVPSRVSTPAQHDVEHEHSLPKCTPVSEPLPPGCELLPLRQRLLPLSGIRAFAIPGEEGGGPEDRRGYILDLVPKLVYQSELLVDLLVRCRCHHYLEFKAVEGSYILQDGALQPVLASRADIFRDRRLSLADKRVLMRFIQGCIEARRGQGHLKEMLSSSQPLAHIMATEGLPPRLRQVILYGIAMCDTDQEPPLPPPQPAAELAAAVEADAVAAAGGGGGGGCIMTGASGCALLELFTSSQGRFGHDGAFMVPSYGSGSVAEAFVRLCAVHGAVTVLRQPVQALLVVKAIPEPELALSVASAAAAGTPLSGPAVETEVAVEAVRQGGVRSGDDAAGGVAVEGGAAAAAAIAGTAASSCVGVVTAAGQVVRCRTVVAGVGTLSCLEGVTTISQPSEYVSRAVAVLDGSVLLQSTTHGSVPHQPPGVGGGDGGVAAASAPKSLLTLVVPPHCQGLAATAAVKEPSREAGAGGDGGGGGLGNPHPVRVLQEEASTCVCPPGRFLLYLSMPATSDSSYSDLWRTLACLTDTSALRDMTCSNPRPPPQPPSTSTSAGLLASTANPATAAAATAVPDAIAAATAVPDATAAVGITLPDDTATARGAAALPAPSSSLPSLPPALSTLAPPRPQALRAWFYRQPVLHRTAVPTTAAAPRAGGAGPAEFSRPGPHFPSGVVALPGPDGGLAGYGKVLEATEATLRLAFPDVKWLAEVDFGGQRDGQEGPEVDAAAAGSGGGGGGLPNDDAEEDAAIDELTAAVARLKGG